MFGVPKAAMVRLEPGTLESLISVMTTNIKPVNAAAEEPTIT